MEVDEVLHVHDVADEDLVFRFAALALEHSILQRQEQLLRTRVRVREKDTHGETRNKER